jgi:acyl-homoserine lactone acylase PvdQ
MKAVSTFFVALCGVFSFSGYANLKVGKKANKAALARDDWGVPHIYARTETAGYYALGYAKRMTWANVSS